MAAQRGREAGSLPRNRSIPPEPCLKGCQGLWRRDRTTSSRAASVIIINIVFNIISGTIIMILIVIIIILFLLLSPYEGL